MLGISGSSIKIQGKKQSTASAVKKKTSTPHVPKQRGVLSPKKVKVNTNHSVPKVLSVQEIALSELAKEKDPLISGQTMIRFNHYQKLFPIHNGVLRFKDVDEEYSFSFVYKGKYTRKILYLPDPDPFGRPTENTSQVLMKCCDNMEYFIGLSPNEQYKVEVEEGEEGVGIDGLEIRDGPLLAINSTQQATPQSQAGNQAVQDITQTLLKMDVNDLHNDEAKQLIEARDLEDVLFS